MKHVGPAVLVRRTRNLLAAVLLAGLALASVAVATTSNPTLSTVSRTVAGKSEKIVVSGSDGITVYELGNENASNLTCVSKACLKAWPALTVPSQSTKVTVKAGVPGRVTILKRVKGKLFQVMLDNHPLYTFAGDQPGSVKGDGIKSFGGVWHVVTAQQ